MLPGNLKPLLTMTDEKMEVAAGCQLRRQPAAEHALSENVSSNGGSKTHNSYMALSDSSPRPESAVICAFSGIT